MIEATITLKLTKDHWVTKTHVTPIQALFLVAEHQHNVGDVPVEVIESTIQEIVVKEKEVEETIGVGKEAKVIKKKITVSRTSDEEIDRLKRIFNGKKIKAVLTEVRDLPTTFEDAIARGMKISLPSTSLGEFKL